MLFSIITICKNDGDRVIQTIESVYSQTYKGYEHIIEDGCSSDETVDRVDEFCRLQNDNNIIIYSEKDFGIYDAMNRAISKANGEYICFLNAGDAFLDPDTLEKTSDVIRGCSSGDVFYGDTIVVFPDQTENSQVVSLSEKELNKYETWETVKLGLNHQAIFAKREIFSQYSFNIEYTLRAELDWLFYCHQRNKQFVKLVFPVCRYALGGVSESSDLAQRNIDETTDILKKYGYSPKRYLEGLQSAHLTKGIYKYIYSEWLSLKLAGRSMEGYLLDKGISKILLYGYGELGCHVIRELKGSKVEISSIIERDERYPYSNIPVKKPQELTGEESVDAMIVTAIMHYNEIFEAYRDVVPYPIISVETLLEDMWK